MEMEVFTTYGQGSWQEQFHQTVAFRKDPGKENRVVNLYPEVRFETFEAFGGAITDAAAYPRSDLRCTEKRTDADVFFTGANELWNRADSHGQL